LNSGFYRYAAEC